MSDVQGSPEDGPVAGADGVARCPWAYGTDALIEYHDTEWGKPLHGERELFERIVLEGFQAGLSWRTILTKRPAFRSAFYDFDPDRVAAMGASDVERLMADASIVRNRAKIEAAIHNAGVVVEMRTRGGLDDLIWRFAGVASPSANVAAEVPATSPEGDALAKALKLSGVRFMGPTTTYALMQAIGMIDPHLTGCALRGRWH